MPVGLAEGMFKYDDIINEVFRMTDPYAKELPDILYEPTIASSESPPGTTSKPTYSEAAYNQAGSGATGPRGEGI